MKPPVTLARRAMATRFEMVLHGDDPVRLRAAGEEALDEIELWEDRLSLFRPASEIAHVNRRAALEPVRVTPAVFHLLEHAKKLSTETGGAFDLTVAPLIRAWGFQTGDGRMPDPQELADARSKVGMQQVELNASDFTVRFLHEGMMLDLGAIGKGFALGRATELLREAGVTSALIHGGTSTVCSVGAPPDAGAWKVAIEHPANEIDGSGDKKHPPLAVVELRDEALSVSAVWGKSFVIDARVYGHVIDPRTGMPADSAALAAVVLPSATETDALSTALLVVSLAGNEEIASLRPGMRTLVAARGADAGSLQIRSRGISPL